MCLYSNGLAYYETIYLVYAYYNEVCSYKKKLVFVLISDELVLSWKMPSPRQASRVLSLLP